MEQNNIKSIKKIPINLYAWKPLYFVRISSLDHGRDPMTSLPVLLIMKKLKQNITTVN